MLIARGANIEHRDKKGTASLRLLYVSLKKSYWFLCTYLLFLSTGFTPLILAATAGHVGVVEILLDKGGDIEAQSERTKDTPLSLACSGGRQEVKAISCIRSFSIADFVKLDMYCL